MGMIDDQHGLTDLRGQLESSSRLSYAVDPNRCHDTVQSLGNPAGSEEPS